MKSAHDGLSITEEEWQATLRHAGDSLQRHGIGAREQAEFLELFARYKQDIVQEQPQSAREAATHTAGL
jgi:hemoglobin